MGIDTESHQDAPRTNPKYDTDEDGNIDQLDGKNPTYDTDEDGKVEEIDGASAASSLTGESVSNQHQLSYAGTGKVVDPENRPEVSHSDRTITWPTDAPDGTDEEQWTWLQREIPRKLRHQYVVEFVAGAYATDIVLTDTNTVDFPRGTGEGGINGLIFRPQDPINDTVEVNGLAVHNCKGARVPKIRGLTFTSQSPYGDEDGAAYFYDTDGSLVDCDFTYAGKNEVVFYDSNATFKGLNFQNTPERAILVKSASQVNGVHSSNRNYSMNGSTGVCALKTMGGFASVRSNNIIRDYNTYINDGGFVVDYDRGLTYGGADVLRRQSVGPSQNLTVEDGTFVMAAESDALPRQLSTA
jgi:hypothetical protein